MPAAGGRGGFDALVGRAFGARLASYRMKYGLTFLGTSWMHWGRWRCWGSGAGW